MIINGLWLGIRVGPLLVDLSLNRRDSPGLQIRLLPADIRAPRRLQARDGAGGGGGTVHAVWRPTRPMAHECTGCAQSVCGGVQEKLGNLDRKAGALPILAVLNAMGTWVLGRHAGSVLTATAAIHDGRACLRVAAREKGRVGSRECVC